MDRAFRNRVDAGQRLAKRLIELGLENPVVLALPRGGVPVAAEVARALGAPLDLLLVRKIGAPIQPELAVAAVSDGAEPVLVVDEASLAASGTSLAYVMGEAPRHLQEIERRRRLYLNDRAPMDLQGATAVLVDDGIATGTTARAALQVLRRRNPRCMVLAVPVAPAAELPALRALVDRLICLEAPEVFGAVGEHYLDFAQVEDDEVVALMGASGPGARDIQQRRRQGSD
ncbi:MAG: phosphoribosyltransferase [Burkholderiaceae bacterium]|nr:phosphoribosyltransferase [Burkholderiaceae bacterium]